MLQLAGWSIVLTRVQPGVKIEQKEKKERKRERRREGERQGGRKTLGILTGRFHVEILKSCRTEKQEWRTGIAHSQQQKQQLYPGRGKQKGKQWDYCPLELGVSTDKGMLPALPPRRRWSWGCWKLGQEGQEQHKWGKMSLLSSSHLSSL